jgi:hypothetical protein
MKGVNGPRRGSLKGEGGGDYYWTTLTMAEDTLLWLSSDIVKTGSAMNS